MSIFLVTSCHFTIALFCLTLSPIPLAFSFLFVFEFHNFNGFTLLIMLEHTKQQLDMIKTNIYCVFYL